MVEIRMLPGRVCLSIADRPLDTSIARGFGMASIDANPGSRRPAIPGGVEVSRDDDLLKYVKVAVILVLDLLVVFLLFIKAIIRRLSE
jgi:hypothetical protein